MTRVGVARRRFSKQMPIARGMRDFQRVTMRDAIYGGNGTVTLGRRVAAGTAQPLAEPIRCYDANE